MCRTGPGPYLCLGQNAPVTGSRTPTLPSRSDAQANLSPRCFSLSLHTCEDGEGAHVEARCSPRYVPIPTTCIRLRLKAARVPHLQRAGVPPDTSAACSVFAGAVLGGGMSGCSSSGPGAVGLANGPGQRLRPSPSIARSAFPAFVRHYAARTTRPHRCHSGTCQSLPCAPSPPSAVLAPASAPRLVPPVAPPLPHAHATVSATHIYTRTRTHAHAPQGPDPDRHLDAAAAAGGGVERLSSGASRRRQRDRPSQLRRRGAWRARQGARQRRPRQAGHGGPQGVPPGAGQAPREDGAGRQG